MFDGVGVDHGGRYEGVDDAVVLLAALAGFADARELAAAVGEEPGDGVEGVTFEAVVF